MPDRRVDGSAKIDASGWPTTGPSRQATSPLRILSGQLDNMPAGKIMGVLVQSAKNGAFKITLNGQTLTLKGLPPSLNGKHANFIIQHGKSGGKNITQLFWSGISRSAQPQAMGKQTDIHTPLPAGVKPHANITASLQAVAQTNVTENRIVANMRQGETTLAIVEKLLGNGRVQLNLKGNRVDTLAPPSIAAGDALMLQMTDKSAPLQVLSVQQNVLGKAHALLRQLTANNMPLTDNLTAARNLLASIPIELLRNIPVLSQLDNWLTSVTVDHETPLTGLRLAGMMQQSGMLLEHKLLAILQQNANATVIAHDLKATMLAMGAGQAASNKIHHLAHILAEIGRSSSSRIESTQTLNVLAHGHTDAVRIELPMLVNQQMVNVQLSLEQRGQHNSEAHAGRHEQAPYKVLISLDMSQLGSLRVDASISESAVHARIYHSRPEAQHLMQSHIERLESRLLNLGFKEVYLLSTPAQPEQKLEQRFDQLEQMKPVSPGLLDIRI